MLAGREGIAFAISTHAPAGGATVYSLPVLLVRVAFLLTPLREGRRRSSAG